MCSKITLFLPLQPAMSQIPVNFTLPPATIRKCSSVESMHGWSDFLGVAASIGCAIHCAALPVYVVLFPAWGLGHAAVHKWMFGVCFLIAIFAFVPSMFRHRKISPIALGSVGLACLGLGAFSPGNCTCEGCSNCRFEIESSEALSAEVTKNSTSKFKGRAALSRIESAPKILAAFVSTADTSASSPDLVTAQPAEGSMVCWTFLSVWFTPIGGTLLVVAHLLNHHFGNFCRCQILSD